MRREKREEPLWLLVCKLLACIVGFIIISVFR